MPLSERGLFDDEVEHAFHRSSRHYSAWMGERFKSQRMTTATAIINTPNKMVKKRICR